MARFIVGTVVGPDRVLEEGTVVIEDGRIAEVREGRVADSGEALDAGENLILPGFVDTHVHGGGGRDLMEGSYEAAEATSLHMVRHGTTSFLYTTYSASREETDQAVECALEIADRGLPGARMVGLHFEGPYVSPSRPGAFPPEQIRNPAPDEYRSWLDRAGRLAKVMTLAPEIPGGLELVDELVARGVVPSLGHTDATFDESMEAIQRGACRATHIFQQMRFLHHRDPGVISACLTDGRVACEFIADGVHSHDSICRLVQRVTAPDRMVLITDAVLCAGAPDGKYIFGHRPVELRDGSVRLSDGTLSGSVLTMNRAVANVIWFTGATLVEVVRLASLVPARSIGEDREIGSLEPGKRADITLVDRDWNVRMTWVDGEIRFSGGSAPGECGAAAPVG